MNRLAKSLAALALCPLLACGDDGGSGNKNVTLQFAARVGSADVACGQTYDNLGSQGDSAEIKDLRFYVSNVRLIDSNGAEVPVTLDAGDDFQNDQVALLDFEDGSAGCAESGTPETNNTVVGSVPEGTYNGLKFDMVVPFDVNHTDLAQAEPPLNISAMFWAWAIGHRFFRLDLDVDGGANRWNVHVGSTMCNAPSMLEPPTEECARPNYGHYSFDSFDPDSNTVVLDIEPLLADSDITANVDMTAFGCQSFPDDSDECTDVYPNLGMDFSTGACVNDCAEQSVFSVE